MKFLAGFFFVVFSIAFSAIAVSVIRSKFFPGAEYYRADL